MNRHREFEIAWMGLKEGEHEFQFEINDSVLTDLGYENQDFDQLEARVLLKFDKKSSFFILSFDIDGELELACDRCGDKFKLPLWDEFKLIVKLTENPGEAQKQNENEEADLVFWSRSETILNVAPWVVEFIMLSIPIQRVHPTLPEGGTACNPETLRLLQEMSPAQQEGPLGEALKKFRNNEESN